MSNNDEDIVIDVDNESMDTRMDESGRSSLANKETKVVAVFRVVLLVLLVATALTVSLLAFFSGPSGKSA